MKRGLSLQHWCRFFSSLCGFKLFHLITLGHIIAIENKRARWPSIWFSLSAQKDVFFVIVTLFYLDFYLLNNFLTLIVILWTFDHWTVLLDAINVNVLQFIQYSFNNHVFVLILIHFFFHFFRSFFCYKLRQEINKLSIF